MLEIKNLCIDFINSSFVRDNIVSFAVKSITLLALFIISRIAIRFALNSITTACKVNQVNKHTCLLIKKGTRYTIAILTIILMLQNVGIEISPLITALGVSGVALSFGMKDIISNIIAGILIMVYQQFKVNDYIKIKDWQGKVVDINIRYTTLETEEMTVFVPNSVLYTMTVAVIKQDDEPTSK